MRASRKKSTHFPSSSYSWYSSVNRVQVVEAMMRPGGWRDVLDTAGSLAKTTPTDLNLSKTSGGPPLCEARTYDVEDIPLGFIGMRGDELSLGAEESVEAALGGQAATLVEAQVPLAHHVGGVACLLELLGQGDIFQGEAVGLGSSDDGVLKAVKIVFCYPHRVFFVPLHMSSCPSLPVTGAASTREQEGTEGRRHFSNYFLGQLPKKMRWYPARSLHLFLEQLVEKEALLGSMYKEGNC
ncbi:hypothetical protein EYF80_034711 [Liparis tanakae]|uniref:Uncharacterized protein n=1 Tax=Liparis tanakae TaxID=230148 RepID=A0A4Z2GQU7_9TELE|nr:hypothetical protein EYF80_034711 [Liparis tanakae]